MIFQSLALANEIGANSYLLDTGDCRIVLDAGMHPKGEGLEAIPNYNELPGDSVDAIMLTHAHLDHAGTLPVLMRDQPGAPVFMTPGTAGLAEAMLHNSVNVMQSKRTDLGITDYPLFGHRELDRMQLRWKQRVYEKPFDLTLDTTATFYDAGHILGSCGVLIESQGKRIFYTGDVQFEDQTLIPGAKFPEENIDTLIIETTRGAAPRRSDYNRQVEEQKFCEALAETVERGGSALVPVFAMGKTQEVLTMIHQFKEDGRLPAKTPVYIGGLSTKMTGIFDDLASSTNRNLPGFKMLEDMEIQMGNKKRKRTPIAYRPGAIFALSSGMMTEKTVSNNFAHGFINNPKNSLLFVGYAAPDSPAGAIRAGKRGDIIDLNPEMPPVVFDCPMKEFDFSGHATRDALLDYILKVAPKQVFLVHGDVEASEWFQQQLAERLPHTDVILPKPKMRYTLD